MRSRPAANPTAGVGSPQELNQSIIPASCAHGILCPKVGGRKPWQQSQMSVCEVKVYLEVHCSAEGANEPPGTCQKLFAALLRGLVAISVLHFISNLSTLSILPYSPPVILFTIAVLIFLRICGCIRKTFL